MMKIARTRSKYGAVKKEVDGIKFDSTSESKYYIYLKEQWIEHERQKRYLLQEKFVTKDWEKIQPIYYISDFSYWQIVVDIKWQPTSDAKMKRKMFMYRYPDLELKWLVQYQWMWVDYFENEKRKKINKKNKNLST